MSKIWGPLLLGTMERPTDFVDFMYIHSIIILNIYFQGRAMSTVILKKWGNSVGVRIPSSLLKEAHLSIGEPLEIAVNDKGHLTLVPVHDKQHGWEERFNTIADESGADETVCIENDFDDEEWTW